MSGTKGRGLVTYMILHTQNASTSTFTSVSLMNIIILTQKIFEWFQFNKYYNTNKSTTCYYSLHPSYFNINHRSPTSWDATFWRSRELSLQVESPKLKKFGKFFSNFEKFHQLHGFPRRQHTQSNSWRIDHLPATPEKENLQKQQLEQ